MIKYANVSHFCTFVVVFKPLTSIKTLPNHFYLVEEMAGEVAREMPEEMPEEMPLEMAQEIGFSPPKIR